MKGEQSGADAATLRRCGHAHEGQVGVRLVPRVIGIEQTVDNEKSIRIFLTEAVAKQLDQ